MSDLFHPTIQKSQPKKPKLPREVRRHAVRDELIRMITRGDFSPGEKLFQSRLANQFGVSMTLIREALLELQAYGLVVTEDNRGIFVRRVDAKTILDLYDLREALEGMSTRLCAGKMSSEKLDVLDKLIDKMCEAADKEDHALRVEFDRNFHDLINEASGNQTIYSLTQQCILFGKFVGTDAGAKRMRSEHSRIVEAIRNNDPEEAETAARVHIRIGKKRLAEALEAGGEGIYWLG